MVWVPTAPAAIPNEETILALLTRSGTDPVAGYITPEDIALAWQSFMSRDHYRPGRNRVINGGLDVWQRGAGPFTTFANTADLFTLWTTGSAESITRQAFALGNAIPGAEPAHYLRSTVTSAAGVGNFAAIIHSIEGVRTFAGQTVTLSWYAKADAAKPMSVELEQHFGTGGSPSAAVTGIGATKKTLGTGWARYSTTVTLPPITGKTVGTNGNDRLNVILWFDAGSNYNARTGTLGQQSGTFDIWGVQLEAGNVPSAFETKPYAQTYNECLRYLRILGGTTAYETAGQGFWFTTTSAKIFIPFGVPMRTNPLLAWSGAWFLSDGTNAPAVTNIAIGWAGPHGTDIDCTVGSAQTQYRPCQLAPSNNLTARLGFYAEIT